MSYCPNCPCGRCRHHRQLTVLLDEAERDLAQGMPLSEDPKGLRPKAGSPVGNADAPTLSPETPHAP